MGNTITLAVDNSLCIKCAKCVKVCPAHIFSMEQAGTDKVVKINGLDNCIKCGHCAAVCPTNAVNHSMFPPQKIHKIDYSIYPSPEQMELK